MGSSKSRSDQVRLERDGAWRILWIDKNYYYYCNVFYKI
jgi:hypothetical protein